MMIPGFEEINCEELEDRRTRGDMITTYKIVQGRGILDRNDKKARNNHLRGHT